MEIIPAKRKDARCTSCFAEDAYYVTIPHGHNKTRTGSTAVGLCNNCLDKLGIAIKEHLSKCEYSTKEDCISTVLANGGV